MDRLEKDLIFDVGLHLGEDSAYYLRKGYRVIGFEANRDLVEHAERRFQAEIEEGRFRIVSGAISDTDNPTVTFYTYPTKSEWGTTEPDWIDRNANAGTGVPVEVSVIDFNQVLQTYGVPWFMKIDIEGADILCLQALRNFEARPAFVSIESEKVEWDALLGEFCLLEELGFDRFAAVKQSEIGGKISQTLTLKGERFTYKFEEHASGPFGEDISWSRRSEVLAQYQKIFRKYRMFGDHSAIRRTSVGMKVVAGLSRLTGSQLPGWYDTHAARSVALEDRVSRGDLAPSK
jgi:FkbM family methyltransferase